MNTAGEFLFVEDRTGLPITAAVADWLSGRERPEKSPHLADGDRNPRRCLLGRGHRKRLHCHQVTNTDATVPITRQRAPQAVSGAPGGGNSTVAKSGPESGDTRLSAVSTVIAGASATRYREARSPHVPRAPGACQHRAGKRRRRAGSCSRPYSPDLASTTGLPATHTLRSHVVSGSPLCRESHCAHYASLHRIAVRRTTGGSSLMLSHRALGESRVAPDSSDKDPHMQVVRLRMPGSHQRTGDRHDAVLQSLLMGDAEPQYAFASSDSSGLRIRAV